MKTSLIPIIAICLCLSCQVIELEPLSNEVNIASLTPTSMPSSNVEAASMLHDDSEKIWQAVAFKFLEMEGTLDCRADDKITLNSDGTYIYDGGDLLCGAEDNEKLRSGVWNIDDQGNRVTFSFEGSEFFAQVDGFSPDTIALTSAYMGLEITGIYISN